MTIELSTTDKRDGKALALFAGWQDWQQGKTKNGRPFFAIPGSEPGLLHMSDQNDCSCPDRQRSRNVCKHMRAVRFWMAAYQAGAVAPKPRPATPSITDDAGIGDDLVILTPEGAAYLAAQRERAIDTDGSRAYLAKLQADQRAHAVSLRARGRDPEDDGQYLQRAEWIARLEARHARQQRDPRPVATVEQRAARGREILARM